MGLPSAARPDKGAVCARTTPRAGSRAQPHLVEPEIAAVRVDDRIEASDRRLSTDGTVAEPEDHVVSLVIDSLLHLFVDAGPRCRIDRHARLLQQVVEHRILDLAIVERAGRVPEAV